jgi:hypothetical protein
MNGTNGIEGDKVIKRLVPAKVTGPQMGKFCILCQK